MSEGITITVNAETAKAAAALANFFRGLEGNLDRMTGLGALVEEIGAKLAVAFSVAGLIEMEREAINAAEGMGKLSQKTGIAVETLSAFTDQAHGLGVPMDQVNLSLGLFADKIFMAVRMGGAASKVFQDIKVRLVDMNGNMRSTSAVLGDVMDRFQKGIPEWEKAGVATELFGRSGRELIPILNEGADGLDRMRKTGGGITPEAVEQATEFNHAIRELALEVEKIFRQLATELLPSLQRLVDLLRTTGEQAGVTSKAATGLADTFKAVVSVVLVAGASFVTFGSLLGGTAGVAVENFMDGLRTGIELCKLFAEAVHGLGQAVLEVAGSMMRFMEGMAAAELGQFGSAGKFFKQAKEGLSSAGKGAIEALKQNSIAALAEVSAFMTRTQSRMEGFFKEGAFADGVERISNVILMLQGLWAGETGPKQGQPGAKGEGAKSAGNAAPMSEEAKQLVQSIDKAFAEATKGRLSLLDEEERAMMAKAKREITSHEALEKAMLEISDTYAAKRKEVKKQEEDAKHETELAAIQGRRQLLEKDPTLSEAEKRERLLGLLRQENALLEKNIALNQKRVADLELSTEAHLAAVKQLQEQQNQHAMLQEQITTTGAQGTFGGEFKLMLVELANQWDSWAKQAALAFKSVFETAISSISKGITGLIIGTKTWGQALREIGLTILESVIQAIVQMGVRWVLTQIMMATMGRAIQAAAVASSAPLAATASAIWSGPATLAATATFGAAAAQAPVAILVAQGIVAAESIPQFAEGGRPPVGRVSLVGERGPELFVADRPGTVVPADRTAALLGSRATQSQNSNLNVGVFHDPRMFEDWARSQDGRAVLVDVMRQHAHELG